MNILTEIMMTFIEGLLASDSEESVEGLCWFVQGFNKRGS